MAKLENYLNAFINPEKLTAYCLNELHPFGKQKALVFKSVLGITSKNALLFIEAIKVGLAQNECIKKEQDNYGKRFSVAMKICIFEKEAVVTTAWIFRTDENFPRLTSCYIKNERK